MYEMHANVESRFEVRNPPLGHTEMCNSLTMHHTISLKSKHGDLLEECKMELKWGKGKWQRGKEKQGF